MVEGREKVHPWDAMQQKGEIMMAREKKGDSVEGRERNTPFRCVAIERRKNMCTLKMHCNKEEKKKAMARDRGRSSRRESARTLGMRCNKKETNGFNAKEKMRVMATVREMVSVDGKHVHKFGRCYNKKRERMMARGRYIYLAKGRGKKKLQQ